ncbi:MAG: YcjX family protein [Desulfovibrio sp.]
MKKVFEKTLGKARTTLSKGKEKFSHTPAALTDSLRSAVDQGLDKHVKLAVTGLSRSGKSAFITALLHQLQHTGYGHLNVGFPAANNIKGVRRAEQKDLSVQTFPYKRALKLLGGDNPAWPPSTTGMSQMRITISYAPKSRLRRKISDISRLHLDIIDYPGEWLLDLPLLDMTYAEWCSMSMELCDSAVRAQLAAPWLSAMHGMNPSETAEEEQVRNVSELYTEYLHACKASSADLSIIQPGRFVLPGELAGTPVLTFFPMRLNNFDEETADKHSLFKVLERRFEYYKKHVVQAFYKKYFCRFDRQIVLLDCLKAMNLGYDTFTDMQGAVKLLLKSFNYGRNSIFSRFFSPRIDKVLFAATKADHVTPEQFDNLENFLKRLVAESELDIRSRAITTGTQVLASIRATEAAMAQHEGQQIPCIRGNRLSTGEPVSIFPGEVPSTIPSRADWDTSRFNFIDFAPPLHQDIHLLPMPHINIDKTLDYLIGDKFK